MAVKWPGMVVQRTFIKGHSFVYRLYIRKYGIHQLRTNFKIAFFSAAETRKVEKRTGKRKEKSCYEQYQQHSQSQRTKH